MWFKKEKRKKKGKSGKEGRGWWYLRSSPDAPSLQSAGGGWMEDGSLVGKKKSVSMWKCLKAAGRRLYPTPPGLAGVLGFRAFVCHPAVGLAHSRFLFILCLFFCSSDVRCGVAHSMPPGCQLFVHKGNERLVGPRHRPFPPQGLSPL